MSTSNLSYALEAAALGIPVFPVWGVHRECDCSGDVCGHWRCDCGGVASCAGGKSAGKHPIRNGGHLNATTDPELIRDWWVQYPEANIGGRVPEGTVVVDVDIRNGGHTSLHELIQEHGMLPATRTTITGNGWHVWFRHDGPTAGKLPDGLDKRNNNNFVVLPGSRHHSGVSYQWGKELEIAQAPTWLTDLLGAGAEHPTVTSERAALPVPLPPEWNHIVRTGDVSRFGGDRSRAQVALIHPIKKAGGDWPEYREILSNPDNGISERWRDMGKVAAEQQARYWWDRYETGHRPSLPQPERISQELDYIRNDLVIMLDANELPRMLAVWWAVTDIAVTHRTYKPILPVRTVAELAGVSKNNGAHKSLLRFVALGALRPIERADGNCSAGGAGQVYQIPKPSLWGQTPSSERITKESVTILDGLRYWTPPNLPVWRDRTARGKLGWLVHSSGDPYLPRGDDELAAFLGLPVTRIRKMIRLLEKDGVYARSGGGWIVTDLDPESLSFPQAEQAIRDQRIRHVLDRTAHRGDPLPEPLEWTVTDLTRMEGVA